MSSIGSCNTDDSLLECKRNFYYPVLNALLLKQQFDRRNQEIMVAIQACKPSSSSFFDLEVLQPLIKLYELYTEELQVENPLAKRTLSSIKGIKHAGN